MAVTEVVEILPLGFKLIEAAWCTVGAIFVSNWRMKLWNVPVFALLVANTFGYAFISILLMLINLTGKPQYFVSAILTGVGSALNFLAGVLMLVRILVFKEANLEGEKPYSYVSEGLLTFWMSLSAVTMLLDVTYNSQPEITETHSSTEEENEDDDGVRRKSQHTETT